MVCFAALGAGNGALFQLVPLRWPTSTAVAGSMIGEIGALGGGLVPMLSGRGLGHTGGTLDKLETIPGWSPHLTNDRFVAQLRDLGAVIAAAGDDLAPADRRMYALRDVTGTVEDVGLRTTRLRDASGQVWYVRNGEILRVGNHSQGWSIAAIAVPFALDADIAKVTQVLTAALEGLPDRDDRVIEDPSVVIESMSAGTITVRVSARCVPTVNLDVQRDLRVQVKEALDAAEEEANGYIGRRYLIPLASPPLFVRGIVQVIARYNLWKNNRPDSVADDAKIARAQLKDIGDGKLAIPGATGILEQSTGGRSLAATSGDANCPIFTEESMAGFDIPAGQHIAHWRR